MRTKAGNVRESRHHGGGDTLERARAGDPAAFADLLKTHDPGLRALAFRLLGDRSRMDDVLQEAYLKAYRSLPRFEGGSAVGTWLYRIVYNACIDDLRARARRPVVPLSDAAAGTASVEGHEGRLSDRSALAAALDRLPEDQRTVVLLVDAEGFDYAAAAEVLGVAPGTVASRLSRAHAALRLELGAER